jgi:hypothetical protein
MLVPFFRPRLPFLPEGTNSLGFLPIYCDNWISQLEVSVCRLLDKIELLAPVWMFVAGSFCLLVDQKTVLIVSQNFGY